MSREAAGIGDAGPAGTASRDPVGIRSRTGAPPTGTPPEDLAARSAPGLWIVMGPGAGRGAEVGTECVIGRSLDAGLRLNDISVSRHHARVVRSGVDWWLEDLRSRNGTALNGVQVHAARLHEGDVIGVGRMVLVFRRRAAHP